MALERIGKYYQKIGEQLLELANLEWKKIYFYIELGEDWCSYHYVILDKNSMKQITRKSLKETYGVSKNKEYEIMNKIGNLSFELRKTFLEETGDNWSTMTFILEENGSCNVDYSYVNLDETDIVERRNEWENKYLRNL